MITLEDVYSCLGNLNCRLNRRMAMSLECRRGLKGRASEAADNCARECPADDDQRRHWPGSRITYARCASERDSEKTREIGHYGHQEKTHDASAERKHDKGL